MKTTVIVNAVKYHIGNKIKMIQNHIDKRINIVKPIHNNQAFHNMFKKISL